MSTQYQDGSVSGLTSFKGNTWLTVLSLAATLAIGSPAAQAQVSFLTSATYSVVGGPVAVIVGDLDGDGDLDLATANNRTTDVSVLKNKGDGTFRTITSTFTVAN